jgi:hypothetical protein
VRGAPATALHLKKERTMRRLRLSLAIALMALALTAGTAFAALTFHQGPDLDFSGASATATFNVSGLGNDPATAQLFVNGTALYTCANKGGNEAPGQNPQPATGASPVVDLNDSEKNGRDSVSVTATLTAPLHIPGKTAGCPNGNWTATLSSLTVTGATLVITYNGLTIYSQTFTP